MLSTLLLYVNVVPFQRSRAGDLDGSLLLALPFEGELSL